MTPFTIIVSLVLLGLTGLCFWLPFKNGQKKLGLLVSLLLGLTIVWTLIGELDFLVIFIYPIIFAFQIIFLTYWIFRNFGRQKIGIVSATVLTVIFLLLAMQPWIVDWTFNEKDAREILSWQDIELKDDFEVIDNESGGFTDYAQSFTLKISQSDFDRIAKDIKSSKNFQRINTNSTSEIPSADYKSADTVNYETEYHIKREYYTDEKKEDGTFHFYLQLSKKERELNYFGINE